jgi:sulfate adenylyltransferase subunit 1
MEAFNNAGYLNMELLRFTTAGSVDDGKSTLIGRLLYDSKSIFEDQYEAMKQASVKRGEHGVNLALLTDGLRAEREQGITIDVAYRYFATPRRKFIIADTPGHIQYTRNMVTGASTANLAIVLVDARKGVIEQTKRHSFIASLLRIPHLVICINKMDLMNYSHEVFEGIRQQFNDLSERLDFGDIHFIPISALNGDNVVDMSPNMPWYQGPALLELLETIPIARDKNLEDGRFAVQYVIRPQSPEHHDFRGFGGQVSGGIFHPGDEVIAMPSGLRTRISSIENMGVQFDEAFPPMSVVMQLSDEIDLSRGNMLVKPDSEPFVAQDMELMICWMNQKRLQIGAKYHLRHTTNDVKCIITEVYYKVDIDNLEEHPEDREVGLNDIAMVRMKTTRPLIFDSYKRNRITGSVILIDEGSNETLGAGMLIGPASL